MDYGTTYHIGYGKFGERAETTNPVPPVGRIRPLDATSEGRKRGKKGQTASCSDSHVANGFLKVRFLPKLKEAQTPQDCTETAKTERDFYRSLSRLAKHYGVEPMPTFEFGFPYNMALAIWDIRERLNKVVANLDQVKLVEDTNNIFFMTEQRHDTGKTLFYIPVAPLYRMSKDKKRRHTARLLLSICAYLYHCADIAYYRQKDSYLYDTYDMLQEWILCDDDGEDRTHLLREIAQAEFIGDLMERKLYNLQNLERFGQRLERFRSMDDFDRDCLKLASEAFALYTEFPTERIYRNEVSAMVDEDEYEDEYDDGYPISMDMYISFCAEANGNLFDNLFNTVNTHLQEFYTINEPTINKRFDGSGLSDCNLDFENRLFALIDELIYLLNKF